MSGASDFNDLAAAAGADAARRQLNAAVPAAEPAEDGAPLAPPTMRPEGFPELLRAIVDAATASSEAHPVAVAANVIAWFGAAVGRVSFQRIGDQKIHCRPFFLVVGKSGKARKGTAEVTARQVFRRADAMLRHNQGTTCVLRFHDGGLSTGEGLAWAIRDEVEADDKGKGGDKGVSDKRLVVIEPEFANVLAQVKREGNTLSATLRNLWDGRDLEPLTKTSRTCASRPHVVVLGHITGYELRDKSTENDAANGLLNRFILTHVHRPKLVPLPEPTPEPVLDALALRLAAAIADATQGDPLQRDRREIALTPAARELWCHVYPEITQDREGRLGSLMARSEVYARMLAMVFALMDRRSEIEPADVRAALAWVDYWAQSAAFVFHGAAVGDEGDGLDPFTADVLRLIERRPGITLSAINEAWGRNKAAEVKAALETLLNRAPPLIVQELGESGSKGGRRGRHFRLAPARDVRETRETDIHL
ncbi:MAG: DUF3987 domain-containing protein [Rubrivivax sp.]|nr:DUF3987 domain-containing protein [Rubrivivax sp.]